MGNQAFIPRDYDVFAGLDVDKKSISVTFTDHQFNPGVAARLFDHLIRPYQYVRRNCQADLLRGFQVDDEFKLYRLLHGKVGGLSALENLVHVSGSPAVEVGQVHTVGHKPARFHIHSIAVYHRESVLYCEFYNLCSAGIEDGSCQQHKDRVSPPLGCGSECGVNVLGT
jgi:hypothetical protein